MKKIVPAPLAVILLDHLTKHFAQGLTEPVILWPGVLELRYLRNTGMAFSLFNGSPWVVTVLSGLLILLFPFLWRALKPAGVAAWSLAVMWGGAVSNFAERLLHGYVTDMISCLFVSFPVFNLADIALTLGCFVTVIAYMKSAKG